MGKVVRIPMSQAPSQRFRQYGIAFLSDFVYRTSASSYPTRVVVWFNIGRPNPRNGEPVRYSEHGRIDGGNGRFLDPSHEATDDVISVLLTTESFSITADRSGTGHPDSGQVWSPDGEVICSADRVVLVLGERAEQEFAVQFTGNGHGRLVLPAVAVAAGAQ